VTRLAACILALVLVAGCGDTREVREPDVVVAGTSATPAPGGDDRGGPVEIWVVTHGQASSSFWTIVRNGVNAASRQTNVQVTYRSPDVYNVRTMRELVDDAVAARPDGLVVSIPSEELTASIRRAVKAGIPVVSINSGSDFARRIGTLAHIGQPEEEAGYQAGRRLARAGARDVLCVNHEVGNVGLDRRCAGFGRALREAGGSSRVLPIDTQDVEEARRRLRSASNRPGVDGLLTLGLDSAELALDEAPFGATLATFDYSPAVLRAVRSGRMEFAVDQQPYLQGYLPVVFLAERARYGLFPAQGEVVPTGPSFITAANAEQVERLSLLGIR
jgi:simple sugar transport system substrate-binding protein